MRVCEVCGTPIPVSAPLGHCPRCLFTLGQMSPPNPAATSAAQPESFPRRFGDYELLELIGEGGMGVVYKAHQMSLNRLVALKMIRPDALDSPTLMHRFKLEAEAAASLQHPHIVSVYEIGETDGQPFFSMEFIEGQGLNHHIASDGFRLTRPCPQGEAGL